MKQTNKLDLSSEKSILKFLREPTIKIAEAITGILVSERKDWKLSTGKLFQALCKGSLLTQLGREIDHYRNTGKIKEDYFATHKNRVTFYELLKFLDEEVPDEELFTALKSIFFSGVSADATQYEESLAYEFLQIAKSLSSTEILILKANFELVNNKGSNIDAKNLGNAQSKRSVWMRVISMQMGYGVLYSVVFKYEKNLESLGLISPGSVNTNFPDEFEPTNKYRLTELGCKFCEFISQYPPTIKIK